MEVSYILDTENCRPGGALSEEKMQTKTSLRGSDVRRRLSDISNLRQLCPSPTPDKNMKPLSCITKEYVEQLYKENMALMRLLAERNKIIELTGEELTKMRINFQKLQQQNWQLAQAQSQMLAELNLGKDRLKAMQHDLGCSSAVIAAKNLELQEKVKKRLCPNCCVEEQRQKCETVKADHIHDNGDNKTCKPHSKRHQSRIQSQGVPTVTEQVTAKEKCEVRRQSARFKSEPHEATGETADSKSVTNQSKSERREPRNEKAETKRRRQSEEVEEPTEDLFEIEDAKFPTSPKLDEKMEDITSTLAKKGKNSLMSETPAPRRSSMGRPTRRAAAKVACYKEASINVKMRRED